MKNNAFKQSRFSKFMKIMYFVSLLIALLGCVTIFIAANHGQSLRPNKMTQTLDNLTSTSPATSISPTTITSTITADLARSATQMIPTTTSKPTTTNAPLQKTSGGKALDEIVCRFLKNINESISITNDRRLTHFPNIQEVNDNFKHLVNICIWENEHETDEIKKAICILINKIEQLKILDDSCISLRNFNQSIIKTTAVEVLICKKNLDYIAHTKLTDQLGYLVRHNYIELLEIIDQMIKELDFGILTCLEVDIMGPVTIYGFEWHNLRNDPPINQTIHDALLKLQEEQRRRQRGKRSLQNRNLMLQRRMRKSTDSSNIQ